MPRSRSSPAGRPDPSATELRIIGGSLRGRKIFYSGLPRTRPMKDRVREAVFNLVGPAVRGKLALDLFAGTGALGFEALSRGASAAILVEQHFPSADLIKKNAALLGIADRCQVAPGDAFHFVRRHLPDAEPPWLVFCSPPFALYADRPADMLGLIETVCRQAPPQSIVVVESDERLDWTTLPNADQWDVRTYAPSIVGVFRQPMPRAGV